MRVRFGIEQKGAKGCGLLVRLHAGEQGRDGGGQDFHLRSEQEKMLAGGGATGDIEGLGSSEIAREAQDGDAFELGIELRAFVVRSAIDHQNLDQRPIVGAFKRGQAPAQSGSAVVRKDERGDLGSWRGLFREWLGVGLGLNDGGLFAGLYFSFAGDWHVT